MGQDHTTRHWRARLRLTFADDPRLDPPTFTRTYGAWIGADSDAEARRLLAEEVGEFEDLVDHQVTELVEVTSGDPSVIGIWED